MHSKFIFLIPAVLSLSSCSILKESSSASREDALERRTALSAGKARVDSLITSGRLERGFTSAQVRKAYGSPDRAGLPSKVPVQGSVHLLTQWVYADRGEYVYFLDGRLESVRSMMAPGWRKEGAQ